MFHCNKTVDLEITTQDDEIVDHMSHLRRRSSTIRRNTNSGVKIFMHLETGAKSPLPKIGANGHDDFSLSDGNVITQ